MALAVVVVLAATVLAGAAPAAGSGSLASSFLEPHNMARRAVGVRPLRWDEGLAAYVRRYVGACWSTRTGPAARTCSAGAAAPGGRPPTWWTPGSRSSRCTTPGPTPAAAVAARAATTRRSCGAAVGCALVPCADGRATFGVGVRPYRVVLPSEASTCLQHTLHRSSLSFLGCSINYTKVDLCRIPFTRSRD